jgi:thiol-disulfide isomerase/thioredoxin
MEIKRDSPVVLAIAVAVIVIAILFVMSTKAQVNTFPVPQGSNTSNASVLAQKDALYQKAPELTGITGYINAPQGLKLSDLRGKVVLIDFWTYSCINCIRTLPYLTSWDQKYRDKGLVIIGVHTPEFDFEKDYSNVQMAVKKFNITYPVVQDNDYATWNAYGNRFWPHDYLIDVDGYIRADHIGEGGYDETEQEIQKLLAERDSKIQMGGIIAGNVTAPSVDFNQIGTPEIYLGYQFARAPIGNPEGFQANKTVDYALPASMQPNIVSFGGSWKNNPDNMELASDAGQVALTFKARNVNIVAGGNSTLDILLDGKPLPAGSLGGDAAIVGGNATVKVSDQRLYSLTDLPDYSQHTITIEASGKGFRIYTFTFG